MQKLSNSALFTLKSLKYTGTLMVNCDKGKISPVPKKLTIIVALALTVFNFFRLDDVMKRLLVENGISGDILVRCMSDIAFNLVVLYIAFFIVRFSREISNILNCFIRLGIDFEIYYKPIFLFILYQVFVAVLNASPYFIFLQSNFWYHISTVFTDTFLNSIGGQLICMHHFLCQCFKILNDKIRNFAASANNVIELRDSYATIMFIFDKLQEVYGIMLIGLISAHCFYFQIDIFYLCSSLYNLSVGKDQNGDKTYVFEYFFWAAINFGTFQLLVLVFMSAENEVIIQI